jgi:hypothetical protein
MPPCPRIADDVPSLMHHPVPSLHCRKNCITGTRTKPRQYNHLMIVTGMVFSIDNRPGIKKVKLTTNNSNSVGTEKCTFFDTKLGIDKFNIICIMLMNAGHPVPNAPAAARGEETPQKTAAGPQTARMSAPVAAGMGDFTYGRNSASAAKRKLDADGDNTGEDRGKQRAHFRPLSVDK